MKHTAVLTFVRHFAELPACLAQVFVAILDRSYPFLLTFSQRMNNRHSQKCLRYTPSPWSCGSSLLLIS
jgi:hypothetical protein